MLTPLTCATDELCVRVVPFRCFTTPFRWKAPNKQSKWTWKKNLIEHSCVFTSIHWNVSSNIKGFFINFCFSPWKRRCVFVLFCNVSFMCIDWYSFINATFHYSLTLHFSLDFSTFNSIIGWLLISWLMNEYLHSICPWFFKLSPCAPLSSTLCLESKIICLTDWLTAW